MQTLHKYHERWKEWWHVFGQASQRNTQVAPLFTQARQQHGEDLYGITSIPIAGSTITPNPNSYQFLLQCSLHWFHMLLGERVHACLLIQLVQIAHFDQLCQNLQRQQNSYLLQLFLSSFDILHSYPAMVQMRPLRLFQHLPPQPSSYISTIKSSSQGSAMGVTSCSSIIEQFLCSSSWNIVVCIQLFQVPPQSLWCRQGGSIVWSW